jgi:hypothetical protein
MNTIAAAESFTHDVRYALRSYLRSPGFTAVALLSLVLGIGATTAMFSIICGGLISPYPYSKPGEISAPMLRDLKTGRLQWPGITVDELADLQNLPAIESAMTNGRCRVHGGKSTGRVLRKAASALGRREWKPALLQANAGRAKEDPRIPAGVQ